MKKLINYTKQHYQLGIGCSKSLFLHVHHPELMTPDNSKDGLLESGKVFEETAREILFPNGIDILKGGKRDLSDYVYQTQLELQKEENTIYQATFQTDTREICLVDVLNKTPEGIFVYEFKMMTKLSDVEYYDAAYQYYCLDSCGIPVSKIFLAYINKDFVKGVNDENEFILLEDVTKVCQRLLPRIKSNIQKHKAIISRKEVPDKDIGHHCLSPYTCPFKNHCWDNLPTNNIFELRSMRISKKLGFYYRGILSMQDLINTNEVNTLTDGQIIQIDSALNKKVMINFEAIEKWLEPIQKVPGIIFLDFETISMAYPKYEGMKPFVQLPTQYSLHNKSRNGNLFHDEFLAEIDEDPRKSFIENLIIDVFLRPGDSIILVYNKSFECGVLKKLAQEFPQYAELINDMISRVVDLMDVFKNKWYYDPRFLGSYSIKKVLPVLCPEMENSYNDLPINNGAMASSEYMRMISLPESDREVVANNLKAYCCVDTLAMVKLLERLESEVSEYSNKEIYNTETIEV